MDEFSVFVDIFSMRRRMKYYECMNKKICPIGSDYDVLFFSICTDQWASEKFSCFFAVFFYAFTLYVTNRNRFVVWILVLASIGIHSSVIMLLPLFFYKLVNTKDGTYCCYCCVLLSLTVDIIDVLMNLCQVESILIYYLSALQIKIMAHLVHCITLLFKYQW